MRQGAGGWAHASSAGVPQGPPPSHHTPAGHRHAAVSARPPSRAAWLQAGRCGGAGSRHLHFRRLFSGAGEKPRSDEIVTKETRKQGPATGTGGCGERGRKGRDFCKPQGRGRAGTPRPPAPRGLPGMGTQRLETERGHESSRVLNFNGNP